MQKGERNIKGGIPGDKQEEAWASSKSLYRTVLFHVAAPSRMWLFTVTCNFENFHSSVTVATGGYWLPCRLGQIQNISSNTESSVGQH